MNYYPLLAPNRRQAIIWTNDGPVQRDAYIGHSASMSKAIICADMQIVF